MDLEQRLNRASAALVVVDVQNDFCHPDGLQAAQGQDVARVQPAVDRLLELIAGARKAGVPVVLIRTTHAAGTDTPQWLARHPDPTRKQSCADGTWGADFYRIERQPEDVVVEKHRYNGFTRTTLAAELEALGRTSLLFSGVTSNTCVETTLRDAVCRDFLATMVEDCCAAYSAAAHTRAVESVAAGFGAVADSATVLAAWEAAATVTGTPACR